MVARCKEDILKARGVKPTLSPNLNTLATVEALDVKRLLFIGVGCQVRGDHPYAFPSTICDSVKPGCYMAPLHRCGLPGMPCVPHPQ